MHHASDPKSRWRLRPAAVALAALALAAAACGETAGGASPADTAETADAEAAGGDPAEVRLATVPNLVGWPAQGAQDLGFFEEAGLTVASTDVFASGPPMVESGLADGWDVALMGSPPAIVAGEAWDLQIAGVQNEEAANIMLFVREGEVDVDDPAADLEGQSALLVGSSLGEQVFRACLDSFGLEAGAMEVVPLEMPQIVNSFNSGEGAVAQVWSEFVEQMEAEGHERLCTGEDAGEQVYTVVAVHPDFAAADPDVAARAVDAIFRANELLAEDLDGALPSITDFFSAQGVELSEEDVRAQSERHDWYSAEESAELLASGEAAEVLGATAEFFVAKGQYDELPEFDFLNADLAEQAAATREQG